MEYGIFMKNGGIPVAHTVPLKCYCVNMSVQLVRDHFYVNNGSEKK